MKKTDHSMTVTLSLDNDLPNRIKDVMDKEYRVALNKWGVSLNSENKHIIYESALEQLTRKVTAVAKTKWSLTDSKLDVIVVTGREYSQHYNLPSQANEVSNLKVIRVHDEWVLNDDPTSDAVPMSDLVEHFENLIFTWARTAVFYGVGSYTQSSGFSY